MKRKKKIFFLRLAIEKIDTNYENDVGVWALLIYERSTVKKSKNKIKNEVNKNIKKNKKNKKEIKKID